MQHSTHPLQYRVHKACISMIYEARRQKSIALVLFSLLACPVQLLGCWVLALAHQRHLVDLLIHDAATGPVRDRNLRNIEQK